MEKRLLKRGETSGRADDNADTIRKRFTTFLEQSLPVKDHYLKLNKCHVISAVPTPEAVFEEVAKALDPILPKVRQTTHRGWDGGGRGSRSVSVEGGGGSGQEGGKDRGSRACAAPATVLFSKFHNPNNLDRCLVLCSQAAEDELVVPAVPGSVPEDSTVLFVLGGPGTGKGTQCDRIKARYPGVVHLSAGDLLRDEVKSGSALGQKCGELMKEGKLVPMVVPITLLKNAMILSGGKIFLVDGFPRALDQAEAFEKDIMPCKTVIFFDCPEVRRAGKWGASGLEARPDVGSTDMSQPRELAQGIGWGVAGAQCTRCTLGLGSRTHSRAAWLRVG
jgi:adenylate kinase